MVAIKELDPSTVFVEQAEYLETAAFVAWTEEHPQRLQILQKLSMGGAKLITGPRGCGKTTLLLRAYQKLMQPNARGLPVYVNFKTSLRLEPLYKSHANAMYWFNQWMLLKCYVGLHETIRDLRIALPAGLRYSRDDAARLANRIVQTGADASAVTPPLELTTEDLIEDIGRVLDASGRVRCLLMLDDAAHAFSPEQQRDFFDFFRRVRSKRIAPKAAIYPGVTIVSPSFHIGHDAEEIDVWLDPYANEYLPFVRSMLRRRLPGDVFAEMEKSGALLDLLCFAAFGNPRAVLNMVRGFYDEDNEDGSGWFTRKFTSKAVLNTIKASFNNTVSVYTSLRHKLPMYQNFIGVGEEFLRAALDAVKRYNQSKSEDRQSVTIAVQTPILGELERVFGFLEYAGLVMSGKKVSRGTKGRFEMIRLHAGGLIDRNALLGRRVFVQTCSLKHSKLATLTSSRASLANLLKVDDLASRLTLALPPCQSCGTPRPTESAKFCLECGRPLTALSTFTTLVQQEISDLPLSSTRVKRIKEHSSIRTVGDILMDHELRELRGVPWIGPYWAERIYRYAEEFIAWTSLAREP